MYKVLKFTVISTSVKVLISFFSLITLRTFGPRDTPEMQTCSHHLYSLGITDS